VAPNLGIVKYYHISLERCGDDVQCFVRFENEMLMDESVDLLVEISEADMVSEYLGQSISEK
jgi:hypothetical protein